MTAAEALKDVRGYAAAGRFRLTRHALLRMQERNVTRGDVRNALINATACTEGEGPSKWQVEGADLYGDALRLVVVIESGVIVVTVY